MEMAGNSSKEIEVDGDDDNNDNNNNDNTGMGRTYECSYCKRGFTNAQALGGHMNIHRKDKAKAKQYPTFNNSQLQSSFSSSSSSSCSSSPIVSNYKPDFGAPQWNYQPYYNPRSASRFSSLVGSNNNNNYYSSNDFSVAGRSSSLFGAYEERLGADLSLKINSSSTWTNYHHQQEVEENVKNSTKTKEEDYDTIDLELRLGYDRP